MYAQNVREMVYLHNDKCACFSTLININTLESVLLDRIGIPDSRYVCRVVISERVFS